MRISKKTIFIIIFLILLSSFFALFNNGKKKEVKVYNVSVISRGKSSELMRIIREGMEQAASEMNVNIRFLTLLEENNINEQIELIKREVDAGSDAMIISPADYNEITSTIEDIVKKVPVILFESNIDRNKNIPYISCDNYELGKILAEEVVRNGNTRKRISIIKSELNLNSINERYLGFIDEIKNSQNTYEIIDLPNDEIRIYDKVSEIIKENRSDIIVTFDTNTLEVIGKSKKYTLNNFDIKSNVELYGIGSTSLVISLIEDKVINSIAMQNEFNVGYLSLKASLAGIEKKKNNNSEITSTIINSRNIYSKKNQGMLFPFIR